MGKQLVTTGTALVIAMAAGSMVSGAVAATQPSTPVQISGSAAGGHEDVEALKAEIASLKTQLSNTETGRQFLVTRLEEVLADSKVKDANTAALEAEKTDLLKSLRFMTDNRDYLVDEMAMTEEQSTAAAADAQEQQASLQAALEQAEKGRRFLGDSYKKSRGKLMAALAEVESVKATNAELEDALAKAKKGRNFLSEQFLKNRTALKEQQAANATTSAEMTAENERLSLALERALQGRDFLSGQVDEWEAKLAAKEKEMDELAEVSFAQINSAMAERDKALDANKSTEWADNLSAELTTSFGSQSGTEVTALADNSVAIKVGNTGLFQPGSTTLSSNGQSLLGEIGQELISRNNAHIRLIGHTDNIPTGSGSRFSSNNELSLARASAALSYLSSIGVPTDRLSASGVGDAYPIASNDTDDGRLANRRVEIVLTPLK